VNPLFDRTLTTALTSSLELVLPEIVLVGAACLLFTLGLVTSNRYFHTLLALASVVGAGAVAILFPETATTEAVQPFSPILSSPFAGLIRYLVLAVGFVLVWLSSREASSEIAADYYACLMVALAGASLTARANDLVTLYLSLEMMSVPTYVLLYIAHKGASGQEAATKYFLLSILSSAILLFGMSYLFGLTGTTNISANVMAITTAQKLVITPLAVLSIILVIAGLGFRITAVPFHYYAPDVYQGGPTAVIAQLAVLPKIAGFVAMVRLFGMTQLPGSDLPYPVATQIPLLLWLLAAFTMTIGNIMALVQDNLKRVLAYSGIAHAGYMLLGLITLSAYAPSELGLLPKYYNGLDALLFYLMGYCLMTLGVFAVLAHLSSTESTIESVDDLAGLHKSHPVAALVLFVSLMSLIGIPLTAGFYGKLFLFIGLYDTPSTSGMGNTCKILTIVGAVNAAIGAVYYLRILAVVFLRSPLRPPERTRLSGPLVAGILCAVGTVLIGCYPQLAWNWVKNAAPTQLTRP
jgi:NADH-quinone oxidoreductase subunit N